ncbi:DUF4145 domain-containing protein [Listeria grayi]|uniref:DUF4145 domain-containing protein n=1 Tax=Listeria grayi TaxID=1641 RepID=UPI00098D6A77|nr:DUF4145 domain-containing protein [Listeria grayi]
MFNEANSVLSISPKSSAALSRLGLEMLLHHLNYHGKSIDSSIKKAVEQGLSPKIQKAMDTLRVIGNNSVHPGQIDVHDDKETAKTLLLLLNVIVEHQITTPNMIDSLFDELPEGAKKHIEKRDKN